MSTDLAVTVAYHRSGPHPVGIDGYEAVCNVRADGSRPDGFERYDDEAGLPDRNREYCELSAFHALTAEDGPEYAGLVHYRRLFSADARAGGPTRQPGHRRPASFDWARPDALGAAAAQLRAAVGDADWVTPPPLDVRRTGYPTLLAQYEALHPPEPLAAADAAVRARHPGNVGLVDHLRRRAALRPFNMVIARRALLRRYAAFLWPVLDDCWQQLGRTGDPYQDRWPGFIAERLMGYWLDVVAAGAIRERPLPVLLLETAEIVNSDVPEQGRTPPSGDPRPGAAAVLARLPAAAVRPLAVLERRVQRARA